MANNLVRKKGTITALSSTVATFTTSGTGVTGQAKSPGTPITAIAFTGTFGTTPGSAQDFFTGSGRYEVIIRRL